MFKSSNTDFSFLSIDAKSSGSKSKCAQKPDDATLEAAVKSSEGDESCSVSNSET